MPFETFENPRQPLWNVLALWGKQDDTCFLLNEEWKEVWVRTNKPMSYPFLCIDRNENFNGGDDYITYDH